MPTHLGHEAITAKLGHADPNMYLGHEQIYPNNVEIQSAAYTNTSTLSSSGGTRLFRVTGDLGSTYNLTGNAAGSYTLASSPYDHSVSIGANTGCSSPAQTVTTTLTPTGNTILQGGGSTFASSFTQSASPNLEQYYNFNVSISISVVGTPNTNVYNGILFYTDGSVFNVTYSGNNNSPSSFTMSASALGSGSFSNITGSLSWNGTVISSTVGPGAFSGSFTKTLANNNYPGLQFQRASFNVNNATASNACDNATGGNNGPGSWFSSNLLP